MTPKHIYFALDKEFIDFRHKRTHYVFKVYLNHTSFYLGTFKKKPSEKLIETIQEVTIRSMEAYHNSLFIPMFPYELKQALLKAGTFESPNESFKETP